MISYRTLEGTPINELQDAFIKAFSDYQVRVDMPLWKFQEHLKGRGYDEKLSVGAFHNERLVGFVLNGLREWERELTAYDLGTGVIEEYRNKGITNEMLKKINEILENSKIKRYLLEVIQDNHKAFQIYEKRGFRIQREFICYSLEKSQCGFLKTIEVEEVQKFREEEWDTVKKFWDFKPSWQNSIDAVEAGEESFLYCLGKVNGEIAGYGVVNKRTGDIAQIGVHRKWRNRGIGKSIVKNLVDRTQSSRVRILNVQSDSNTMIEFLKGLGFQEVVSQYEMMKS